MSRKIKFSMPERDQNDTPGESDVIPMTRKEPPRRTYGGANGVRLGLLCLMLVMVIMAMNQASKPESWNWLFKFDKVELPDNPADENAETAPSNNSFVDQGQRDSNSDSPPETGGDPVANLPSNDTRQLEFRFWRDTLDHLDGQQQLRLFNLVEAASRQSMSKTGSTASLRSITSTLGKLRSNFSGQLNESSQSKLTTTWNRSLQPAFDAILGEKPDPALIDESVRSLPSIIRKASLELIRDKTPIGRVKEAYAWFACWSEVYDQPIEQRSDQTATVTELLSQPEVWRGQTIQVTGTAMRVERVEASHNALGIDRYYVIWIKPDHPSSFPYCVYTLMAPESLMGEPGEKMREVNQRVQTSARFFKNRLFDAGEAAVAPVLMTTSVEIPPAAIRETRNKFRMPGGGIVLLTLGLIGGLAALIAFSVFRSTTSGKVRALPKTERLQNEFTQLQDDERVETTAEKLQRLSQEAGDTASDLPGSEPDDEDD